MKIVTVMGSPHKSGNTATALSMFEELVKDEHDLDRIVLADFEVKGCQGCFACQQTQDAPGCVVPDDGNALLERITAADAVVYATPLYMWGMTALLHAFIERHISLVKRGADGEMRSLSGETPLALLVTSGGPEEKNADLIKSVFARMCQYSGRRDAGTFVVGGCTNPDQLGDDARAVAAKLAEAITG